MSMTSAVVVVRKLKEKLQRENILYGGGDNSGKEHSGYRTLFTLLGPTKRSNNVPEV